MEPQEITPMLHWGNQEIIERLHVLDPECFRHFRGPRITGQDIVAQSGFTQRMFFVRRRSFRMRVGA